MSEVMRALIVDGPRSARVGEVKVPRPAAGQVVVDVHRVGICGTDVELFTGELAYFEQGKSRFPLRPGHEWCGVVSAVGLGVDEVWLGTRVTGDTMLGCGRCNRCRAGNGHVCADRHEIGITAWPGALADRVLVPATSLHRLPASVDDRAGALVEPGGNAQRAVAAAQARPGRRILVCGPGTIGLLAVAFATAAGADVDVLAADPNRRDLAATFGASRYWTSDDPPAGVYNAVIDCTGDDRVPASALELVEPAGRVVYIGVSPRPSPIDSRHIVLNDLTVVGILGASAGLATAIAHYADGRVVPGDLAHVVVGLDRAVDALSGRIDPAPGVKIHIDPGVLPSLETDRARALLAAGLADDAAAALDAAIAAFRRQRRDQHLAEAELARAQAAQMAGDLTGARRWAGLALRRFRARGNHAWAALAELTRLRAAFPAFPAFAADGAAGGAGAVAGRPGARRGLGRIGVEAEELAGRLRAHGLAKDAAQAELLAARAFTVARRRDDAARCLAAAEGRGRPLEVVLLRRLARAEQAAADGRTGAALAELRAGLATLHTRRGQLGSLDLQTGTAALGAELAGYGLRLVLGGGAPRHVFSWLERSRAQAFRVHPVRPPTDPEAAAVLAELRQLGYLIRTAELSGDRPDPAHLARRAELQRQVRQRSWRAGGLGPMIALAGVAAVAAALAESGQALACIAVHDQRLLAVTIGPAGQARLVRLGDFGAAAEAAVRLTADLDALAGRRLPPRLEAVIRESVRRQTLVLEAEVVAPLLPTLGRGGVVIVPVGALASVPWGMLPGLRGRPVTVCPSASSWLAAWRAADGVAATDPTGVAARPPVLVAGPGLQHAVPEVSQIAAVYPGCQPLVAAAATVEATLRALDGAPLAHLAAHGYHDRENVLFSRLDLADGPLMAYDVQRLSQPPRHVVLSACDVGRTVVRPGDEILGFTAALLHLGTATVISSVSRVDDETALATMTAYHRALSAGARPAEALALAGVHAGPADAAAADAALDGPLAPFVCFGIG